ncbi:MAG: type III-A CRISPR-associated protein Csm2 [Candidatus Loosdrechtia sp.]|uniref:type III-A CRISPR-associated protein Csm2 n=1 Tax=Candidatus Loosdrechtia sp. TaxID=3101272 RepID=UPI003A647F38|nr:MAG: type III-A CRISPR-associated protein Csm2 [Candidatus Jettenia sp. AMX2]
MTDYRNRGRQDYGQRQGQTQQRDAIVDEIKQKLKNFQSTGLKNLPADELVNIANKMGKHLENNGLKTTQIRRFLDGVRKIDVQSDKGRNFKSDLVVLLKPKLAYAAGRDPGKIMPLMQVLEPAITAGAKTYDDFKRLVALIEGIIAYHRFYGGRDS